MVNDQYQKLVQMFRHKILLLLDSWHQQESGKSTISGGAESSHTAAQTFLTDSTTLSPDEVYHHIFMVVEEEMAVEPSFLSATIIQYMRR